MTNNESTQLEQKKGTMDRLQLVEQELHARLRQQAAVAELGQRALASVQLSGFLEKAAALVAETLDVPYCEVLELDTSGEYFIGRASHGWQGRQRFSAGEGSPVGYCLKRREPLTIQDMRRDKRFTTTRFLREAGVRSGAVVPIMQAESPYGVLCAYSKDVREFSEDDFHFLQSIANIIGTVAERVDREAKVRSNRDQLSVILKGVAEGITVQDRSGELIYANSAAALAIGFTTEEELIETPVNRVLDNFELLTESGTPFDIQCMPGRLALADGQSHQAIMRFRSKTTGEERWSQVKSTPIISEQGEVEMTVNIFQDITELKRTEQAQRFLAEAGSLLSASLAYHDTLSSIAQLAVPQLADWCTVHLIEDNETPSQIAIAHSDPQKVELARELQRRFPTNWQADSGLPRVLKTGNPEFYPEITEDILERTVSSSEHLELIKKIGIRSAMIVPLVARGRTLGAISLVWAESKRTYSPADVALIEELARRAALAIDNARLYQESQDTNAALETRVKERTSQLQNLVSKLKNEIIERKKVEEALRQNENMLNRLFEAAPDGKLLVDEDGIIVRVNTRTETMFGYDRQELVGQHADRLLAPRARSRSNRSQPDFLRPMRRGAAGSVRELYGQRKDGSEFPIDINLNPVETAQGKLVIAAVRDITERKQMEAELMEVQRRLLESVEAERLHLAQELHDGPMQELYGISYQLSSWKSGFGAAEGDDQVPVSVDEIQIVRDNLQNIISGLRATASDLRPPALAPYGLEKAIQGHIESVRSLHPELEVLLDLMADEQQLPERLRLALFRIYQHAVSNVIRHARATRCEITFAINGSQVVLEIKDNGSGFSLPHRWVELARQGHMGLVGTVERVQAINGQLDIITEPGKGTVVRVVAPYASDPQVQPSPSGV